MLITAEPLGESIRLLARAGWLKDALVLAGWAVENRRITPLEHRELVSLIRYAPPMTVSRPQDVYGLFHGSVVSSLQFTRQESLGDMREAFRQAVRWIEIETSSQCNRRCSYCPNSIHGRAKGNDFLDWAVFSRLLDDLAEVDFSGEIVFSGNNEILMHERNFDYLAEARQRLGGARLVVLSNGDYLDRPRLERLRESGIDRLVVTLHPGPGKPYDEAEVERRAGMLSDRTGVALVRTEHVPGRLLLFAAHLDGMEITAALHNFAVTGHNWAGVLPGYEEHVRTDPCGYPLRQFVVNHDGDIFACCVAFRERDQGNEHSGMVTGNLRDYPSIFHAYGSEQLLAWRRALFSNAPKTGPCRTCTGHAGHEEALLAPLAALVEKHLAEGGA